MKTVGQIVEESLQFCDGGSFEMAFVPACEALKQTAEKVYSETASAEPKFQQFIRGNWRLISFMGIPKTDSIPPNLPFSLRRAVPSFNIPNLMEEMIIFVVRQTLITHRLPFEIGFHKISSIKVEHDKLLFPRSLVFAILGSVIFHPSNKDEKLPDKYWMNIRDFKMFISELWGRADLAKRVMELYRGVE